MKQQNKTDKAVGRWKMEFKELKYICHSREMRKWIKRQLSRARRRMAKYAKEY